MNYLAPILLFACSRGELLGDSDRPAWDPDPQTISNSSSSTTVSWQPPEDEQGRALKFYNVVVQSEFGTIATETQTLETTLTIEKLRSDTEYSIEILACYDEECSESTRVEGEIGAFTTEPEKWRILGMKDGEFSPLLPDVPPTSLINLSTLELGFNGWLMSSVTSESGFNAVKLSILHGVNDNGGNYELDISTPVHSGLRDSNAFTINSVLIRKNSISTTDSNRIELLASGASRESGFFDKYLVMSHQGQLHLDSTMIVDYPFSSFGDLGTIPGICQILEPVHADTDTDGDGLTENQGDCNDFDATIPGYEVPENELDDDCDGLIDENDDSEIDFGICDSAISLSNDNSPLTLDEITIQSFVQLDANTQNTDHLLISALGPDPDDSRTTIRNIYLESQDDYPNWELYQTDGNVQPLISNAMNASVYKAEPVKKLYYFDLNTETHKLRYWDPGSTGGPEILDVDDLDDAERVRTVSYVDEESSYYISPEDFRIVHQEFFESSDGTPMMLITLTEAWSTNVQLNSHTTLAVLTNP